MSGRSVFSCLGSIRLRRRWWGSRCPCSPGGYLADATLGLDGTLSPRLHRKACRLAADVSFAKTAEHLGELLGVSPVAETIRVACERQARRIAGWQGRETASAPAFRRAWGRCEFTVDAGKVNTIERGWRDLKIAVAQKRPPAQAATPEQWESRKLPEATARVMWADISASRQFRRSWSARLRRLGVAAMARLHVLGDGASWIWKAAGRALSGCRETLDIFHASEHIALAGHRLFGENTAEATAFHEHGRGLLLHQGWGGICQLLNFRLPGSCRSGWSDCTILPMTPRGPADQRAARRRLGVTRVNQGWKQKDVAAFLGVSLKAVGKWVAAHKAGGDEALASKLHSGAKPKLSKRQERSVLSFLAKKPQAFGYKTDLWATKRLAEVIQKRYGIRFHSNYLAAWLRQRGYSPPKPQLEAKERKSPAIARWVAEDWPWIKKKPGPSGPTSS